MAALSGYSDCVQLLLDLHASVSAVTFHYGSAINLIGAGSTPLHYAACAGSLKCCQILLSRGASRLTLNCNGWLPLDVAKMWGRRCLEPLLLPNSDSILPVFSPSKYLSLPLMSILYIARECGLQSSAPSDDANSCVVCFERTCNVAAEGCAHQLCVKCALYLCSTSNITCELIGPPGSIPCPLRRNGIVSFIKLPSTPSKELKPNQALSFCSPCILHRRALAPQTSITYRLESRRNRGESVPSEVICPLSCTPFPSVVIPSCSCEDDPCPGFGSQGGGREQSPLGFQSSVPNEMEDKLVDQRLERMRCSGIFWNLRSCHREHRCNSEINV